MPLEHSSRLRLRRFTTGLVLCGLAVLGASSAQAVGTRHFVVQSEKDFSEGELKGVAVDSQGRLRAGLHLGNVEIGGVDSVWDALETKTGLLLATGNQGKLLRVSGGKVQTLAEAKVLALTALAQAFGDRVIVGAMPGDQLFELDGGKLVEFAKLEPGTHVWDLAYDAKKQALFAATGPEGKLYRITADGTTQVYFDSDQAHLVSVATGGGNVYCGSSGKARLYQLSSPGRAQVLHDFEATEVRAIALTPDGDVVAIANELKEDPRGSLGKSHRPAGPRHATPKKGQGVVARFFRQGGYEQLFESKEDHLVSLSIDEQARPVVGTGSEGRVYRLGPDRDHVLVADVEQRQVSGVFVRGDAGYVVASDPAVVHPILGSGGIDAVWTSKVLDAGIRARYGRMSWDADGDVALSTRSGNTSEPDETWSDWSPDQKQEGAVKSPTGRYFQVRTRLSGQDSVLRRVEIPFVTDNLRPVVTQVTTKSAASTESTGQGMQKSGEPIDASSKPQIAVSWKVDNPDEDELRYFVEYRLEGSEHWFAAHDPRDVLTKSELTWKTSDLPEGKYRLRVTASDELSNPPQRVQRHRLVSEVVLVDNSAPRIEGLAVKGRTIRGVASDGIGPVRRIEARIAGYEEWIPFEPVDGIFDQPKESFVLDLGALAPSGPILVTVRVFDTAGNFEVRHVRLGAPLP